jgi:four helix bundle protein
MTEVGKQIAEGRVVIKNVKDLKVYKLAYKLAMEVFEISKKFPAEERCSLTDQIRRSSRSVSINIREGYAKRRYEQVFIRHLNDSLGSSEETRGWLDFAKDCKYITQTDRFLTDYYYNPCIGKYIEQFVILSAAKNLNFTTKRKTLY